MFVVFIVSINGYQLFVFLLSQLTLVLECLKCLLSLGQRPKTTQCQVTFGSNTTGAKLEEDGAVSVTFTPPNSYWHRLEYFPSVKLKNSYMD